MSSDFSQRVLSQLKGLGQPLLFFDSLDSTNSKLKELGGQGQAHGACVAADFQSKGRGRMDRQWQAQPGSSLLFSVLLRPQVGAVANLFPFTAMAALAVCYALEEHGLQPQIKWPNDIFLHGLKLCGMLSEIGKDNSLVIGIGVNVKQTVTEMEALAGISLAVASSHKWNRADLLAAILNKLSDNYSQWQQTPYAWHSPYIERSWLLGKHVVVQEGSRNLQGDAVSVGLDGALIMQVGEQQVKVHHGDVSILAINGKRKCNCRPS